MKTYSKAYSYISCIWNVLFDSNYADVQGNSLGFSFIAHLCRFFSVDDNNNVKRAHPSWHFLHRLHLFCHLSTEICEANEKTIVLYVFEWRTVNTGKNIYIYDKLVDRQSGSVGFKCRIALCCWTMVWIDCNIDGRSIVGKMSSWMLFQKHIISHSVGPADVYSILLLPY